MTPPRPVPRIATLRRASKRIDHTRRCIEIARAVAGYFDMTVHHSARPKYYIDYIYLI
jgi:hypothetical protein